MEERQTEQLAREERIRRFAVLLRENVQHLDQNPRTNPKYDT